MSMLQFLATVIGAVVAPFALYVQQRQQNKREVDLRAIEAKKAAEDADRTARERAISERREAYIGVLRAVGRYRARAAVTMTAVERLAGDPATKTRPTSSLWYPPGPNFPVEEFAAAQEAVAIARLWAPAGLVVWVTTLDDALRASAASPIASDEMTAEEAWGRWESLRGSLANFALAAERDLTDREAV